MMTLKTSQLKAALHCAASKDARYYLNGVLLECCANGDVHIVSTDGNTLFAGLVAAPDVAWGENPQRGPWRMIVPRDAVATAIKAPLGKKGMVNLQAMPDGRYMLNDTVFSPIDGVFPDWRRMCPSHGVLHQRGEKPGQFNPDLLARCADALRDWFSVSSSKVQGYLHQHETSAAVMTGPDCTAFCVCMPLRSIDKIDHFTPAPYGA